MKKFTLYASVISMVFWCYTVQAGNMDASTETIDETIIKQLNLTDEQVVKIESLHDKYQNDIDKIPLADFKEGALVEVIQSGKWDDAAVKKQLSSISKIQEEVRYYRMQYYFEVSKILSPEQKATLKKDIESILNN
ncbi:Spy/CpxP family protein refolding chaperone [Enterobacter roggenkampii]